uniref:Uncharacterized protein n=1 Tax=Pavo cristatus TaxID=9049 RepID=A0A8C9FEE6_PAVCR
MAYDDSKKKEEFLESDRSADDIRAHREKKRYYKDLVQEEERITTQVRKAAEKTGSVPVNTDSDFFASENKAVVSCPRLDV